MIDEVKTTAYIYVGTPFSSKFELSELLKYPRSVRITWASSHEFLKNA
jgi:hypothetical protein